jgi:hypothetical protein
MTDNEKIPYLQCLYHTGKKVYKYWIEALAVIGIASMIGLIVASAWKQIIGFATTIRDALGSIGCVLATYFNNIQTLICTVPWYWWVAAGVIIGPFILVAIYCALKHFDIDIEIFSVVIITILSITGLLNFCLKLFYLNIFDSIIGAASMLWLLILFCAMTYTCEEGGYDY